MPWLQFITGVFNQLIPVGLPLGTWLWSSCRAPSERRLRILLAGVCRESALAAQHWVPWAATGAEA